MSVPKWLRRKRNKGVVRACDHRSPNTTVHAPQPIFSKLFVSKGRAPVSVVRYFLVFTHSSNQFQTFLRADIPFSSFFDLCEDPRLDQRPASNHDPIYSAIFNLFPIILGGEGISAAENWNRRYCVMREKHRNSADRSSFQAVARSKDTDARGTSRSLERRQLTHNLSPPPSLAQQQHIP